MRLRRKPWARPELAACPFFVDDPPSLRGRWAAAFPRSAPIHLELGCGKGGFLAARAAAHPEINNIAIDLKSEVLALAKRKTEEALAAAGRPVDRVDNVLLLSWDIERLHLIFGEEDRVERIDINFCNPWSKRGDHKHRLTHPRQLLAYRRWLAPEARLWFKTDDEELFRTTLEEYLPAAGYRAEFVTWDLAAAALAENVPTEHEEMFMARGVPIKFLRAVPEKEFPQKGKQDEE